jgi:hypothetical protein
MALQVDVCLMHNVAREEVALKIVCVHWVPYQLECEMMPMSFDLFRALPACYEAESNNCLDK